MKFFEVTPFDLRLDAAAITAAAQTLTPDAGGK